MIADKFLPKIWFYLVRSRIFGNTNALRLRCGGMMPRPFRTAAGLSRHGRGKGVPRPCRKRQVSSGTPDRGCRPLSTPAALESTRILSPPFFPPLFLFFLLPFSSSLFWSHYIDRHTFLFNSCFFCCSLVDVTVSLQELLIPVATSVG